MLDKRTRKRIKDGEFLKDDANTSSTRTRLKIQVKAALEDLALIYEKLPDDELEKLFSPDNDGKTEIADNMEKFMEAILNTNKISISSWLAEYAFLFALCGLKACAEIYMKIEPSQGISQEITDKLMNAASLSGAICDKISRGRKGSRVVEAHVVWRFK